MRILTIIIGLTLFLFNVFVIIRTSWGLYLSFRYPETYPLDDIKWYIYYMITEVWLLHNINKFVPLQIKKVEYYEDETN
jgi:hypothetical protein